MSGIEVGFFGSFGRDAERKTSKAGKRYLRLNVRVGDGEDVQWVGVMAFDEQAIEAADKLSRPPGYTSKGGFRLTNGPARMAPSVTDYPSCLGIAA